MAAFFRAITEGLGTILSFFYDVIPSYGIAIILLTITVRVVLLPLAIKQIRSQQAMQRLQPHLKALEQKYKGNRQKLNEERMKLMKEHQVNPLGGCLPLLLQLPIFIALYQVLTAGGRGTRYLPEGSALVRAIQSENASFLGMNLACNPSSAGRGILEVRGETLDCGSGFAAAIPFFVMVGLMVFTTYYQQKQMQLASGQQQAQMQLLLRIMPLFLGFISLSIPAGVLVYWVTTNLWQVGQQYVMLRAKARADVEGSPAIPPKPSGPKPSGRNPGKPGGRNAGSRKKRRKR